MMKKKKLQKILFSKELLKATKEVQKEWIQELGLENLDQTEIEFFNRYRCLNVCFIFLAFFLFLV